jgi:hypothetical protein
LFETRELGLAFGRKHRLVGREIIAAVDLAGETILLQSELRPSFGDLSIRRALDGRSSHFDVPVGKRTVEDCLWLASMGLGLAVGTHESAEFASPRVAWLPMDPALPALRTYLSANPLSRAAILPVLIDFLCD